MYWYQLSLFKTYGRYSETYLNRPLPWETTCLERPDISVRRSHISMQLNLSSKTTCLERPYIYGWCGLTRQVLCRVNLCWQTTAMRNYMSWNTRYSWRLYIDRRSYISCSWTCHQRPPVLTLETLFIWVVFQDRLYCTAKLTGNSSCRNWYL